MEMFNSFKLKPSKMLTFLCAQDFRRDQFHSHYKNVHLDIQSGELTTIKKCCSIILKGVILSNDTHGMKEAKAKERYHNLYIYQFHHKMDVGFPEC